MNLCNIENDMQYILFTHSTFKSEMRLSSAFILFTRDDKTNTVLIFIVTFKFTFIFHLVNLQISV